MNKQWCFQSRKKPVSYRLGKAGHAANALFRMLGLNDLDDDAPSSSSPWAQNHGGDAQTSLMPVSISIGRRRYR
jgi:hypothetical protein